MYEAFYGLKEKPFRIVPSPDYLYRSAKHQNALTYLDYGLMENAGFILLTGEVGTGKTTLIKHLANKLDADTEAAVIFNTNVSAEQLLNLILRAFGLKPDVTDKGKTLNILYQYLIERFSNGKRALLVVDEAQSLPDEALEELRMLSNLQSEDQGLLQIILVAQPELKSRLRQRRFAAIAQRIAVNFHLAALNQKETAGYIAHRLKKAGGTPDIFASEAVSLISRISGGVPRSINLLCDAALVYGFGYELKTIGIEVIQQVIRDRGGLPLEVKPGRPRAPAAGNPQDGRLQEVLGRIQALEKQVERLTTQVEWQVQALERRADGFKDDLVGKMKTLLSQERKRSDILLARYARLRQRCAELEKARSKTPGSK
jgi:general secretion pathway protein A